MITHAKDVSEFVKWVGEVRKHFDFTDDDPWVPWFRGQCANWDLCPKLYRGEYGDKERLKRQHIEDEIREEFIVRAPALSESIPSPDDDWGWYFLMQHYEAPHEAPRLDRGCSSRPLLCRHGRRHGQRRAHGCGRLGTKPLRA